jgi:glycosyltransferase involved in cell wall biosynthesis
MRVLDLIFLVAGGLGGSYALASIIGVVLAMRRVPVLAETHALPPERWPRVSVVIPARNEAAEIEAAVRSRLEDDYPDLDVVLVDDRSTDGTGHVMDRLAQEDGRVRAVHISELPAGWLGKLHALDSGTRTASGEILLFSDADVHVAPGALRRAVALLEADRLDHLAVVPAFWSSSFLLDIAFAAFCRFILLAARPWAIADPRSRAAFGVGAFNLVRRSAFERTPGFRYLKLDPADDAALGQMLKRSGARCALANGRGDLGLRFYASLGDMARGLEKLGARWPFRAICIGAVVLLALELGPWIALVAGSGWSRVVGAVGAGLSVAATVCIARWMRHRILPALLAPVGAVLVTVMMVRASTLALARGGVSWRGTFYRTEELRAGSRFELGW